MTYLYERATELWQTPAIRAPAIVLASLIAAKIIEVVLARTIMVVARRTKTTLDDVIVESIRRPILITVVMMGLGYALEAFELSPSAYRLTLSILQTLCVLVWASAAFRIGIAVLATLSSRSGTSSIVQPRTMPLFEILVKISVAGATIYFLFLAWSIDLTAWLASAGIIGIAVGFAAKDTLANLFAGIFIVVDAPYKLGDFIVLDGDLRGWVTKIGIRSTRVLTLDDVEITVPNALIGSSKIVNETGGPSIRSRIKVQVEVAYGSDIDLVRTVLLKCPAGVAHVAADPAPQVRFTAFGGSGLQFQLLVWLELPAERGNVLDRLNCAIYKQFAAANIEIPYSKHDVYIKELPAGQPRP